MVYDLACSRVELVAQEVTAAPDLGRRIAENARADRIEDVGHRAVQVLVKQAFRR